MNNNKENAGEESLEQSEKRFRSYFNMSLYGIAITSPKKGWIEVNDKICSMLGYSREEILSMTWAEMTHPDDLQLDVEQFNRVLSDEINQYYLNKRFIRKDEQIIWVKLSVVCVRKSDKSVDYLIATLEDITESKKNEDELMISESRFKTIFEEAPLGIALIDSLTGHIYSVNPMFAKIAGRTIEEMAQIDWMSITHPDDIQKDLDSMARLNAGEINNFQMEKRYLHKDGSIIWINMVVSPVFVQDKSHPLHLCMIEDITLRKKEEEELLAKEKQYKDLFEGSRDALMILEPPTWRFTSGNHTAIEMFRAKDKDEFTSFDPSRLSPEFQPDGRSSEEKSKEMIDIAMKNGSNFFEWTHKKLNGDDFFTTVLLSKIDRESGAFLQATVRDISESKEKEEELSKMNGFMMNREVKMIELKKEIASLKEQITKLEGKNE